MKLVIITSGSSQLLTQLAVLREDHRRIEDYVVLYNGVFRNSLDVFFNELSVIFGFQYLGSINFNINPKPLGFKSFVFPFLKKKMISEIESQFPVLKKIRNPKKLLITVRVKMFSDIVLISYLKPKKVHYTADGIIDYLPERNFKGINFTHLSGDLKKFPIPSIIFGQKHLKEDIKTIGKFKEVSWDVIEKDVEQMNVVQEFKNEYFKTQISWVIISQHFHLHEKVSLDDDVSYWTRIINYIRTIDKIGLILFKFHPRDTEEKIRRIRDLDSNKVLVVHDKYQSLPLEIFSSFFKDCGTSFITGNSSGTLFFRENHKILAARINLFDESLNIRIESYAKKYNLQLIEV